MVNIFVLSVDTLNFLWFRGPITKWRGNKYEAKIYNRER
jgi:hypothetical protein